jgi:ribonuclease HI
MRQKTDAQITIFADGACSGNPGPGGWGAIVILNDGTVKELGNSKKQTTNNEMELRAVIEALDAVREHPETVSIYTDSTYIIFGITRWIWGWLSRDWKTAEGKDVTHKELWKHLLALVSRRPSRPEWHYVRGHTGVPGNERCDEIAVRFSQNHAPLLFSGKLSDYDVDVFKIPKNTSPPEIKKSTEKKVVWSYLSVVNGVPKRHPNWKECETRVKGVSGAKFRKSTSAEEELEILADWGFGEEDLQK